MKIICLSDIHQLYFNIKIKPCTVLIFAGDIDANSIVQFEKFNVWLDKQKAIYKICIAGNHDGIFKKEHDLAKRCLHAIYLEDEGVELCGIHFWGSPYTKEFMNWYFMERPNNMDKHWSLIPKNTDVLITHGPPYGILDVATNSNEHLGCKCLLNKVMEIKPKYHIFGHIHHSYGIYKTKDTTFINCSILNDSYNLVNSPMEFDI